MFYDNKRTAEIFRALCDENRIAIIKLLGDGSKCACHIGQELGLSKSRLSYHMKILCESEIVKCWNSGKWIHYKIDTQGSLGAIHLLNELITTQDDTMLAPSEKMA